MKNKTNKNRVKFFWNKTNNNNYNKILYFYRVIFCRLLWFLLHFCKIFFLFFHSLLQCSIVWGLGSWLVGSKRILHKLFHCVLCFFLWYTDSSDSMPYIRHQELCSLYGNFCMGFSISSFFFFWVLLFAKWNRRQNDYNPTDEMKIKKIKGNSD